MHLENNISVVTVLFYSLKGRKVHFNVIGYVDVMVEFRSVWR